MSKVFRRGTVHIETREVIKNGTMSILIWKFVLRENEKQSQASGVFVLLKKNIKNTKVLKWQIVEPTPNNHTDTSAMCSYSGVIFYSQGYSDIAGGTLLLLLRSDYYEDKSHWWVCPTQCSAVAAAAYDSELNGWPFECAFVRCSRARAVATTLLKPNLKAKLLYI